MVVVFTIIEINSLLIGLFDDLMQALLAIIFVSLSSMAALIALIRPLREKGPCPFPKSYTLFQ